MLPGVVKKLNTSIYNHKKLCIEEYGSIPIISNPCRAIPGHDISSQFNNARNIMQKIPKNDVLNKGMMTSHCTNYVID